MISPQYGVSMRAYFLILILIISGCNPSKENKLQEQSFKSISFDKPITKPEGIDDSIQILRISPFGEDVQNDRQIVIQFNKQVVALGEMARTKKQIPLFLIPSLDCEWRWIGLDTLACQLGEKTSLSQSTKYKFGVRESDKGDSNETKTVGFAVARYLSEQPTKDGAIFTTIRPRITSFSFAEWLSPEIPSIYLYFNQEVSKDSVTDHVFFISPDGRKTKVSLKSTDPKEDVADHFRNISIRPVEELSKASSIKLMVEPGIEGKNGAELGNEEREVALFDTHEEPKFIGVRCCINDSEEVQESEEEESDDEDGYANQYCGYYFEGLQSVLIKPSEEKKKIACNPQAPISLVFSSPVGKEALLETLSITPSLTKDKPLKDLIESFYSYTSANVPHKKGREYTVRLPQGLTPLTSYSLKTQSVLDLFGREVSPAPEISFDTASRLPRLVVDNSDFVLEKNVNTHLPAVVQNIDEIQFSYRSVTAKGEEELTRNIPVDNVPDVSYYFPIKIREFLGGSGFIQGSFTTLPEERNTDAPRDGTYIGQVTPFHIQIKYGHFSSLAWVTDLSTGGAVSGAEVRIVRGPDQIEIPSLSAPSVAKGVTDEKGFLSLPGSEVLDPNLTMQQDRQSLYAVIRKGDDLGFVPLNWNFRTGGYQPSVTKFGYLRTWGMTPQGIYKLGDTVSYKIVVRNQDLKSLTTAPREGYSLTIIDPLGKEIHKEEKVSLSQFGTYTNSFVIPQNGSVGLYEFKLKARFAPAQYSWNQDEKDGRIYSVMKLMVADFTPAPFKVSTEIKGEVFGPETQASVELSAKLHAGGAMIGAKTRLLAKVKGRSFEDLPPSVEKFYFSTYKQREASEYEYEDETSQEIHSSEGTLENNGMLETYISIPKVNVYYGDLIVEGSVEDDRGKRIADLAVAKFASPKNFVGLHFQSWTQNVGKESKVDVAVINRNKEIVNKEKIKVSISRTETTAARVKSEGNAYITRYENKEVPVSTCELVSSEFPVACAFVPTNPGVHTITAIVGEGDNAHQTSLSTYVTGAGDLIWRNDENETLELIPEKNKLFVGDTAKILVKNPFPGAKALKTIERYGVISKEIITLEGATPIIEVPITEDLVPGFYVGVSIFSPRIDKPLEDGSVDLGKPALRIGSTQIAVSEKAKELSVTVASSKEKYKPREKVEASVHIDGAKGAPVELAVAVLDEAVFDLILQGREYFNPLKQLYSLDELSVATFDNLLRLVGRRSYLKKGANSGGDGLSTDSRDKIRYVAYWNPSLEIDSTGNAKFSFDAPDNLTSWRVFAVALNQTDKMGLGEGKFAVSKELELRPNMPNQVREGDTFQGEFTVLNRTDKKRDITVTITSKDPVAQIEKVISLGSFERGKVGVPLTAGASGIITFNATAKDLEFSDSLTHSIDVHKKAVLEKSASYASFDSDEYSQKILFPQNIRQDLGGLEVILSPTIIGGLKGSFEFMQKYPYMCWEQRISKAILAAHFKDLSKYIPGIEWNEAASLPQATIDSASAFQSPNGGMAYFLAQDDYADPYLSAFTALGFQWLKSYGYQIPKSVEEKLHNYLIQFLKAESAPGFYSTGMSATVRSVILAALAPEKKISLKEVKRYKEFLPQMSLFGKGLYLKALQSFPETQKEQKEIRNILLSSSNETGGKLQFQESIDTDSFDRILTTPVRDNCVVMEALLGSDAGLSSKMVHSISETRRQSGYWSNTQENLFCTRAMLQYAKVYEKTEPNGSWNVMLGDASLGTALFKGFTSSSTSFKASNDPGKEFPLKVTRDAGSKGRAYVQSILSFAPSELKKESINSGIEIRKEYSRKVDGEYELLTSDVALNRGDTIRVDLYLSLPAARNFVVVDDPIPGGFEAVNTDLKTASSFDAEEGEAPLAGGSYWYRINDWIDFATSRWSFYHRELKFDSARFYSEYLAPGNYHLSYVVQAIAPGKFVSLPARAEEMYDPDVFGQTVPQEIIIEGSDIPKN